MKYAFYYRNKKVLLRERKRHTARRVVSTPSVGLPGYPPPPILAWGVPCWGVPYLGAPGQDGGGGVPYLESKALWDMGTPPPQLDLARYPPSQCLPHGILGNVAKHYGIWVPPPPPPPPPQVWTDKQSETITAGGNYTFLFHIKIEKKS